MQSTGRAKLMGKGCWGVLTVCVCVCVCVCVRAQVCADVQCRVEGGSGCVCA